MVHRAVTPELIARADDAARAANRAFWDAQGNELSTDSHQIALDNARANSWYATGIADTLRWLNGSDRVFASVLTGEDLTEK